MSIINTIPTPPPAPVYTSAQAAKILKERTTVIYNFLKARHTESFNFLYSQTNPLAVIEEFGTDAKMLFEMSGQIQDLLKAVNPDYEKLEPPVEVEFNEDGTINA